MRLLLDTHTLLWWLNGGRNLSRKSLELIRDPENDVFVSSASAWEIALKKAIGKLVAPDNLEEEILRHQFERLPILFSHVSELLALPPIHRDPFDRMLVAQSKAEDLTLVTRDENIRKYGIDTIPA